MNKSKVRKQLSAIVTNESTAAEIAQAQPNAEIVVNEPEVPTEQPLTGEPTRTIADIMADFNLGLITESERDAQAAAIGVRVVNLSRLYIKLFEGVSFDTTVTVTDGSSIANMSKKQHEGNLQLLRTWFANEFPDATEAEIESWVSGFGYHAKAILPNKQRKLARSQSVNEWTTLAMVMLAIETNAKRFPATGFYGILYAMLRQGVAIIDDMANGNGELRYKAPVRAAAKVRVYGKIEKVTGVTTDEQPANLEEGAAVETPLAEATAE